MIASAPSRSARQLIYIIAASDSSEIGRYANQCEKRHDATCDVEKFKRNGGIIAVMEASSSLNVGWFAELASPGYYDTSFADNINYYLNMLCFANCFCPRGLIPFSRPDALNRNAPDGDCFFSQSPAPYSTAKKVCRASGARLATIHDLYKQFFLMQASGGKPFWIGGVLNGEQLEPIDDSTAQYTNWAAGELNASRGRCAYSMQSAEYASEWHSADCSREVKYICALAPCSVDNFCK
ncbi:hypothetical protein PRIPAC_96048 [Pristionchus pacificus]|uniref:C-type lectin n=1 Tax=Pristionchus pacificus TaxID=54126 RepID=A0A2A6B2T6_PRIPA|nr:hypothetical protein PRIPAC_96048 [Pristionchus pacificus]|eukprot:PDM60171.1 C-type lectin [Pristionchus pacificus]